MSNSSTEIDSTDLPRPSEDTWCRDYLARTVDEGPGGTNRQSVRLSVPLQERMETARAEFPGRPSKSAVVGRTVEWSVRYLSDWVHRETGYTPQEVTEGIRHLKIDEGMGDPDLRTFPRWGVPAERRLDIPENQPTVKVSLPDSEWNRVDWWSDLFRTRPSPILRHLLAVGWFWGWGAHWYDLPVGEVGANGWHLERMCSSISDELRYRIGKLGDGWWLG